MGRARRASQKTREMLKGGGEASSQPEQKQEQEPEQKPEQKTAPAKKKSS